MKIKSDDIHQVNDTFFAKMLESPENMRDFLAEVLPDKIKKNVNLSNISSENIKYISNQYDKGFSDFVVKTVLITKKGKKSRWISILSSNISPTIVSKC
jgi:hypothetical protein